MTKSIVAPNPGLQHGGGGATTIELAHVGRYITPGPKAIAPVVVSILPSMSQPTAAEIAALLANIVPFIVVFAAKVIAPSATQNILQDLAPLVKITNEEAPAAYAPPNLKINTALVSPKPSRVRVPAKEPAPAIVYTPAARVSPPPNAGV